VNRPPRVCVLGDSLVAGVGDPAGLGWTGRLAARTQAAGLDVTLYPLGIRGETAVELGDRWRRELRPRLPPAVRGAVVLASGVNDGDPRRAAAAVLTAARGVRARRHAVLVLGPPPFADPGEAELARALEAALAGGCAHHGLAFTPVLDALVADGRWLPEAAAGDGDHPGEGGYAAYADVVWEHGWPAWLSGQPAAPPP